MGCHAAIGNVPSVSVVSNTSKAILDPQQLSCKIILNPFHSHEYHRPPPHLHKRQGQKDGKQSSFLTEEDFLREGEMSEQHNLAEIMFRRARTPQSTKKQRNLVENATDIKTHTGSKGRAGYVCLAGKVDLQVPSTLGSASA